MKIFTVNNNPIHLVELCSMNFGIIFIVNKITNSEYVASVRFNMRDGLLVYVGTDRVERLYFKTYGEEWIAYYVERIVEDFT